jgi:hypothetical protein
MARQQARVAVDQVAQRRELADAPGNELSERHHDSQVRGVVADGGGYFRCADPFRAKQRQLLAQRDLGDGRWRLAPAPSPPTIGLADDDHHPMGAAEQSFQRRHREFRGAEEGDA